MIGFRRSPEVGVGTGVAVTAVGAQALSGVSNFGVQLGLALTLSPARFGAVTVGFSVYYFVLSLLRALFGDPLVALSRLEDGSECSRSRRADALWVALIRRLLTIAVGAMVPMVILAVVFGSVRAELGWLALTMPGLLLQDGYRYWCWGRARPGLVLALDGVWVAGSGLLALILVAIDGLGSMSGMRVLVTWTIGGIVSAAVGRGMQARLRSGTGPDGLAALGMSAGDREATRSLGTSQAILAVDANGLPVAVALAAGPTVSGALRAAALPFMPMTTVIGALRMLVLPALRRAANGVDLGPTVAKVTAAAAAIAVTSAVATLALLSIVPTRWLGPTGELVRPWFAAAAVIVAARMITLPLSDVLSLGADQARVVRYRLGTTLLDWIATLTGALVAGVGGAIGARAMTAVLAVGFWSAAVAQAVHRSPPASGSPQGSGQSQSCLEFRPLAETSPEVEEIVSS